MNNLILKKLAADKRLSEKFTGGLNDTLLRMESELRQACVSKNQKLEDELVRTVTSGGKRLRPLLALLAYKLCENTEYPIVPAMCAIELVHIASLIHDDIVDKAVVRRGVPTISAACGEYFAVQAGDYLLAKSAPLVKLYKGLEFDDFFADTAREMCLAEFSQIDSLFKYNEGSLERYFLQIKRKTAGFMASAVAAGAVIAKADEKTTEALKSYGEKLGLAFQIKDDVLDYDPTEDFGKKSGQDLKRGIFTLPLLYALRGVEAGAQADAGLINKMRSIAASVNKTNDDIRVLLNFVRFTDAAKEAQNDVIRLSFEAKNALSDIKDCEAKTALEILAESLAVRSV